MLLNILKLLTVCLLSIQAFGLNTSLVQNLGLVKIAEGGAVKQVWTSPVAFHLDNNNIAVYGKSKRYLSNVALYYLDAEHSNSFHKIILDEVWTYVSGDSFKILILKPNALPVIKILGKNFKKGEVPSVAVPSGSWMGGYAIHSHSGYTLFSLTDSPSFIQKDYAQEVVMGNKKVLVKKYPAFKSDINKVFAMNQNKNIK
jgi:predicted cupin superfamily sugar epimerase